MARVVVNQTNFTAGELSPRMKGRGDVSRYQNGAETIENGICTVHGGVVRRRGTRYLAATKYANKRARLIRYVYSVDQAFILEFGAGYIRIFDAATGAAILNDGMQVIEVPTPYTERDVFELTTKQSSEVMYIYHQWINPHQLRRLSPTMWALTPVHWTVEPFSENGHLPSSRLVLSDPAVGAGRTFTTTPASVPGSPTGVAATPFNGAASVSFSPPAGAAGMAITGYTVTASPGGAAASGASSPIRISGLSNGTAYTFTVTANNAIGSSPPSAPSAPVTPEGSLSNGLVSATASSTNVSKSAPSGYAEVSGPTVTASGGVAPYRYAWSKISGSGMMGVSAGGSATLGAWSENYGATNYASFRCVATDAAGASGSVDINLSVRHATGKNRDNEVPR